MIGSLATIQLAVECMRGQVRTARAAGGGALVRWSFYVDPVVASEILGAIEMAAVQGHPEIPGLLVTVPLVRRAGRVLKAGRFLGQAGQVLVGHVRCDVIAVMDGVPIRIRKRCAPQTFTLMEDAVADRIDQAGAVWPGVQP